MTRSRLTAMVTVLAVLAGIIGWELSNSGAPSIRPGEITVPLTRDGGGILALSAKWGHAAGRSELLAVKARFTTCYSSGFFGLGARCPDLAIPYFKIILWGPGDRLMWQISTAEIQRYDVRNLSSGWIRPVNPRTRMPYALTDRSHLEVQVWAFSSAKATLTKIAHLRA